MSNKSDGRKVVVIGLDGMAWHTLDKLFKHDAMPYLKNITKNSLRGILKSTIPPMTPPAWTSIATGVNPGKHGIFDFVIHRKNRLACSLDVQYPRIHEMIALKGMKSVCINQPLTYPITRIKGSHVLSDWMSPVFDVFPSWLKDVVPNYQNLNPNLEKNITKLIKASKDRVHSAISLMEKIDWNLFWIIYSESDFICHIAYDKLLEGDKQLLEVFKLIDKSIGIAHNLSDMLVIVSDHGFKKYNYTISVNSILDKLGFVKKTWTKRTKEISDFTVHNYKQKKVKIPSIIHRWFSRKPLLKETFKGLFKLVTGREITAECPYPDPELSQAYVPSHSCFGVYTKNDSIAEIVIKTTRKYRFIGNAWKREKVFSGPHVVLAPHVMLLPKFNKGFTFAGSRITPTIISKGTVYDHHPDGIVIISGENIHPVWLKHPVETVDVVPTILRYMSLPLPINTDGKNLPNIDYPENEVRYYDYLKHWQLIRQIQLKKSKLSI